MKRFGNQTDVLHALAIAVPLLVMAGWLASLELRAGGDEVRLHIEGFDPRDLLSGHYLTYRVDYGVDVCSSPEEVETVCVCLDPVPPPRVTRASWHGRCDERPADCKRYLEGHCEYGRLVAGIERFYFDEQYADRLRVVPPDASIAVRLGDGSGLVTGLFVGPKPLGEWLSTQPAP